LPARDAADSVDFDVDAVRNAQRRLGSAEDHGDAALAGERGEMRGAAAELCHDRGDGGEDVAQPRARDTGDEDVAGRDPAELAFAADDAGPSGGAADAGGLASHGAAGGRRFGLGPEQLCRSKLERPCLDELEASVPEDPFDLDRVSEDRLRAPEQAAELPRLGPIEARRHPRSCPSGLMRAARGGHPTRLDVDDVAVEQVPIRHHLALRDRRACSARRREEHLVSNAPAFGLCAS
jgi:hypothetical protein